MQVSWNDWIYPLLCVAVPSTWAAAATLIFGRVDSRRAEAERVAAEQAAAERAAAERAEAPDYVI